MSGLPVGLCPPATGGWREGDPAGGRRWSTPGAPFRLESGQELPGVRLAYQTWGTLDAARSNAVLVLHGLTGDSHLSGPAGPGHPSPGWWDGLVGRGRALDTDRFFVVVPNALGGCQGSTGPSTSRPDGRPWGSAFPRLSIRDLVAAEARLADELGIARWAAVIGGSMGGMRALEWAVGHPHRVARALLLACPAATSARQIAWTSPQLHAIAADPHWHGGDYLALGCGGPRDGLGIARRIAHATYRGDGELTARFGRRAQEGEDPGAGGRFAIESYLDHHADKLVRRFDANSYVVLTRAMNSHDVGRGRGGTAAALARVTARTMVAGVSSDDLYPLAQQAELAAGIREAGPVRVISSPHGHDGFLVEVEQVAALVKELLAD
ncbi:homoserine O-acetyltransferase [Marinactinospora thermotolerans DSM 45154]|uniref:Homoserine O-acetyltransferase n=1 Tax=Marinactinospora thermotolerans DSM 45154 TaxID=1122192 RepID=A0A1T4JW81_9ACTN|nr:homoserine O-acetyltransferase [Marinactinospora thermotolerans DSM 45154]